MDITTVKESDESLFEEMMNSSGELNSSLDSSSSERRRVTLQRVADLPLAFSVPKAFSNSLAGGLELPEQVATYNRRQSKQFHIRLQENEQVYSGLLKFNYFNGQEDVSENVHVHSSTTTEQLIPQLLNRFLPSLESRIDAVEGTHHTYIALVQGEMERELSSNEKPLQIALDCSTKGVASPKFVFKTSLSDTKVQDPHHTDGFTSYVGSLTVHSSSESCESSRRHSKITDGGELDQASMASFGSAASLSSKSSKSKSTTSLNVKSKKPLSQTLSNHETNRSPDASPVHSSQRRHTHIPQGSSSPMANSQKQRRPKSVMSNFITRSLRVRKKSKQNAAASSGPTPSGTPAVTDTSATLLADGEDERVSSLVSPLPMERKFTMSAVMHIYYTEAKRAQVYKSVLVSEKATTREVIAQALERYNMKFRDPDDFVLCEVIGKWQDITGILPANISFQINKSAGITGGTASLPSIGLHSASPIVNRRTAVEQFVECYTRELSPEERPYSAQFFLTTQDGFTRRFELRSRTAMRDRSKSENAEGLRKTLSVADPASVVRGALRRQAMSFDGTNDTQTAIFGQTAHRRRARRNRLDQGQFSADAADDLSTALDTAILGTVESHSPLGKEVDNCEGEESGPQLFKVGSSDNSDLRILGQDEEENIPIAVNPLHPPDFATLTCSSPDSGVAFQKSSGHAATLSEKSSVSSEQYEQKVVSSGACGVYRAKLNTAFLLSLHLYSPDKEYLVHRLGSDRTIITSSVGSSEASDTPNLSESKSESYIILHHPELARCKHPICCICRQPIESADGNSSATSTQSQFIVSSVNTDMELLVNGQSTTADNFLLRHGDLLSIGGAYLFMFQDYSSVGGEYIPDYNWKPLPVGDTARMNTPIIMLAKSPQGEPERNAQVNTSSTRDGHHILTPGSVGGGGEEEEGGVSHHWHHNKEVSLSSESEVSVIIEDTDSNLISVLDTRRAHGKSKSLSPPRNQTVIKPPQRSETDQAIKRSNSAHQILQGHVSETSVESVRAVQLSVDGQLEGGEVFEDGHPAKKSSSHRTVHTTKLKQIHSIPKNRKLVFSFTSNEEDLLLDFIIMKHNTVTSTCKLTPAYVLAMCVEYSMMCNGQQSSVRFVQKAVDRIQEIVWEYSSKVRDWQPDPLRARNPLSIADELFSLLQPIFFWLANILEFYNYLTSHQPSLNLTPPTRESGDTDNSTGPAEQARTEDESPLVTLKNVMEYSFQQAFYPVSKVLFHSLPVMLEKCVDYKLVGGRAEPIVIYQAVDFLQVLLDLLTELQLHLEVVAQFFSNMFFFINASMFNSLMEQGVELQLFQYSCGTALRANLNLLEGWACQVGFKDSVLHYLAKFSSAIDLLATPSEQLLKLNWSHLRHEFPVLNPAQIHYIVNQYMLPPKMVNALRHWAPSKEDATAALTTGKVQESFDDHPRFAIPSAGYSLDLSKPPPQADHFQAELEALRRNLKKPTRSVDIVPVIENRPCPSIPTLINSVVTTTASMVTPPLKRTISIGLRSHKGSHSQTGLDRITLDESPPRNRRNIGSNTESQEDLLEETRNNRLNFRQKFKNTDLTSRQDVISSYEAEIDEKLERQTFIRSSTGGKERVEKVRSLVAPRSFTTPEKLVVSSGDDYLNCDNTENRWLKERFPPEAKLVTVPRGDKGFGLIMVEENNPTSGDSAIFVQRVLPGSTAEVCNQIVSGDQILAIDGQLLDGADYLIADKYLKQAEDDVSLVLVPRTCRAAVCQ